MKKQSKKKKQIIAVIIIIAVISLLIFLEHKSAFSGKAIAPSKIQVSTKPAVVTKENFPAYLQNSQLVKDLPKDAAISLKLYNFDAGERQWEESYIIEKSKVQEGLAQNPDLEIWLHSKYIPQASNFCSAAKKAKSNGDIAFELKLSKVKFLWKYRGMMKYKECFGF